MEVQGFTGQWHYDLFDGEEWLTSWLQETENAPRTIISVNPHYLFYIHI